VMGITMLNVFMYTDWVDGQCVPLSRAIDMIDYVCQLVGNAAHVGIGTDWYGGSGTGHVPEEFDSVIDLQLIAERLRERGYSEADIAGIMGGNMIRVLRQGLPESSAS
jgi:membrane dipeptidase